MPNKKVTQKTYKLKNQKLDELMDAIVNFQDYFASELGQEAIKKDIDLRLEYSQAQRKAINLMMAFMFDYSKYVEDTIAKSDQDKQTLSDNIKEDSIYTLANRIADSIISVEDKNYDQILKDAERIITMASDPSKITPDDYKEISKYVVPTIKFICDKVEEPRFINRSIDTINFKPETLKVIEDFNSGKMVEEKVVEEPIVEEKPVEVVKPLELNEVLENEEKARRERYNAYFDKKIVTILHQDGIDELQRIYNKMSADIDPETGSPKPYTKEQVNEAKKQYEMANRMAKNIEFDSAIKYIFGDEIAGSQRFNNIVKETIARMAHGEKVFDAQKFFITDSYKTDEQGRTIVDPNTNLPIVDKKNGSSPFYCDYKYSTRFMFDILEYKYPDYVSLIPKDRMVDYVEQIQAEYHNKNIEDLNKKYQTKKDAYEEFEYFEGSQNPEENRIKFNELLDAYLAGEKKLPVTEYPWGRLQANTKGLGYVAKHILKFFKQLDKDPAEYGLTPDFVRDACDKKLDATLVSEELTRDFNTNLGKRAFVGNEGADWLYQEKDSPDYKVAENKVYGLKNVNTKKDSPLLTDALSTYARLSDIHSKRSGWFWLTNFVQNITEYFAIKNIESVLKNDFHMTNDDLKLAKENRNYSMDYINQAALYANGPSLNGDEEFKNLGLGYDSRKQQIDNVIEAPRTIAIKQEQEVERQQEIQQSENNKLIDKNQELQKKLEEGERNTIGQTSLKHAKIEAIGKIKTEINKGQPADPDLGKK